MSDDDFIRQGRVRRAAPVAGLTARTAGEAVVAALRARRTGATDVAFHERTAERYAELLGNSKGALMKAGQILSFASLGAAVPPEFEAAFHNALGRLRSNAPPMAPELARRTLEQEVGLDGFADVDWEPLAAASIGQVHEARLRDGRRVAVKIQYPGVADAIRADLKNVELLATFMRLLVGVSPVTLRVNPRAVAREVEGKILEELDYEREAANQTRFADAYRDHPFIRVPAVIEELSTPRVLTQDYADGLDWEDAVTADRSLRDSWGEVVERFTYGSLDYFRIANTDPHPGNYRFRDDGTVWFLDFGSVEAVPEALYAQFARHFIAVLSGSVEATWAEGLAAGLWDPADPVTHEEAYAYWRLPRERYWAPQPFTVTPDAVARWSAARWSPTGPCANAMRHVHAPEGWTLMGRMDSTAAVVLGGLRATGEWASVAAEWFEGAPPRTEMGRLHGEWLARHPTANRTYA